MPVGKPKEKTTVLVLRIVYSVLFVAFLTAAITMMVLAPGMVLESTELLVNNYSTAFDETDCTLILEFNEPAKKGTATVKFYDRHENYIETQTIALTGGNSVQRHKIVVEGDVEYFEVIDVQFEDESILRENSPVFIVGSILIYVSCIMFGLAVGAYVLSCKEYEVNENHILVYAGYYKHYIKVNGEKYDEHNTIRSFTPIRMSCKLPTEEVVDVTITLSNRISTKVDGRLISHKK